MAEPIVEIENASVLRHRRAVLREISFEVRSGEFVGVIGPNGAGKTTLLRLINGLASARDGSVRVLGNSHRRFGSCLLRRRIGYVAQLQSIDPKTPITIRETVAAGGYGRFGWLRRGGGADPADTSRALNLVGIGHLSDRPLGQVSGGEFQRAAIARVLVQQPELFLFDEPTASLDPRAQEDILGLIQRLCFSQGSTVIYVTHELATLPEACNRVVLMKGGTIWRQGARTEMLCQDVLNELYRQKTDG